MNIYKKLNEIKKEVDYVQKDAVVTGYKAVTHDAVTAITRASFIKHGVVIVPTEITSAMVDTGTTTVNGNPWMRFEAKYAIQFIDIDSGDDKAIVELTAHALDVGDKAPGKALSYAVKSAILKVLQIESGESDEGRDTDSHRAANADQSEAFFQFIKDNDSLGLFLFTKRVGAESYLELFGKLKRTFPQGNKQKLSAKHGDSMEEGQEIWFAITEAIKNSDVGMLSENIDGMSEITGRLLDWYMSDEQKTDYAALKNEIGE